MFQHVRAGPGPWDFDLDCPHAFGGPPAVLLETRRRLGSLPFDAPLSNPNIRKAQQLDSEASMPTRVGGLTPSGLRL